VKPKSPPSESPDVARALQILDYLERHPPAGAREVSVRVFGGSGHSRSSERAMCSRLLHVMERGGLVVRVPQAGGGLHGRPVLYAPRVPRAAQAHAMPSDPGASAR
jgi:hypothetical protein